MKKTVNPLLKIRNATVDDIPLIRELTFEIWPQTYKAIISKEQIDYMLDMMYSQVSLGEQMEQGCCFVIVERDQEPVGFASYEEISPLVYKLHKIYILSSEQGKGTGTFLMDGIITAIRQRGGNTLQLQVNRKNIAKSFYEKLGFVVTREADFPIGQGWFMNDFVMGKKL